MRLSTCVPRRSRLGDRADSFRSGVDSCHHHLLPRYTASLFLLPPYVDFLVVVVALFSAVFYRAEVVEDAFSSRALFKKCKASSSLSSKNFSVVFFLPLFLHRLTTTISAARKSASRISSLREGISRKRGHFFHKKKRKKSALSLCV